MPRKKKQPVNNIVKLPARDEEMENPKNDQKSLEEDLDAFIDAIARAKRAGCLTGDSYVLSDVFGIMGRIVLKCMEQGCEIGEVSR